MKQLSSWQIYDKNNDNMYVGYVVARTETEARQIVEKKHDHFSDDELEVVWEGNQGTYCEKSFGLEKLNIPAEEVLTYSTTIN